MLPGLKNPIIGGIFVICLSHMSLIQHKQVAHQVASLQFCISYAATKSTNLQPATVFFLQNCAHRMDLLLVQVPQQCTTNLPVLLHVRNPLHALQGWLDQGWDLTSKDMAKLRYSILFSPQSLLVRLFFSYSRPLRQVGKVSSKKDVSSMEEDQGREH